jgi:uncharacterized protein YjbI with pentapeptide repeats
METNELSLDEFLKYLDNNSKLLSNISIEDYSYTLNNRNINEITFENSFININFKNCSLNLVTFKNCNLKCITFDSCNMTSVNITECLIESLEIKNCILHNCSFEINYAYGQTVDYKKFIDIYSDCNKIFRTFNS